MVLILSLLGVVCLVILKKSEIAIYNSSQRKRPIEIDIKPKCHHSTELSLSQRMKSSYQFNTGDVIRPLPKSMTLEGSTLMLPDDEIISHSESFNSIVVSHFLIATAPIKKGDKLLLNFNTAFFDLRTPEEDLKVVGTPIVNGFRYLDDREKEKLYLFADESVRRLAIDGGFIPRVAEKGITVQRSRHEELVAIAAETVTCGAVVFTTTGVLLPFPVRSTVEVPNDKHLRLTGGAEFIRHSCLPNMKLDIQGTKIMAVALRPIEEGEALTFNYLCTEWEVSKVFNCSCNVYCCYGIIKGFKYLDAEQQSHLLPNCSGAVTAKYHADCVPLSHASPSMSYNALVSTTSDGYLASQRDIPSGSVLFSVVKDPYCKDDGYVTLDHLRIPHSCDANVALFCGKVVAIKPLVPGDVLTANANLVSYQLPGGFTCDCGSASCCGKVLGFKHLDEVRQAELWSFLVPKVREIAEKEGYVVSSPGTPCVYVKRTPNLGNSLYAFTQVASGSHILHVKGCVLPFPSVYTVFLGENRHLLFGGGAQCLAHSCQPNSQIVVDPENGCLDCFALKPIEKDELITFNYLTTEWDMDEPFQCCCGSGDQCFKRIEGFRHLSKDQQLALWESTTSAVRARYAQTQRSSIMSQLNSDVVSVSGNRELVVNRDCTSGTILFRAGGGFEVRENEIMFGDLVVRHSCSPTAALLQDVVVLSQSVLRGDSVTLNINQLMFKVSECPCQCGSHNCCQVIRGFHALSKADQNAQLLCTLPEVRASAVASGYVNESCCSLIEVRPNGQMGQSTFAAASISKGTRFFEVNGLVISFPTVYTIMLDSTHHLLFAGGAQCLAHSCDPNVRIIVDVERRTIACQALRDIQKGELVSFNYLTTEWNMSCPFKCACGSNGCFGLIRGFRHLSSHQQQRIWSYASPAIRSFAAAMTGNWERLNGTILSTDVNGKVRSGRVIRSGEAILEASSFSIHQNAVTVDGVSLYHRCEPNSAIVGGFVILLKTVCAGTEITLDVNLLSFQLQEPFACSCGDHPPRRVTGFSGLTPEQQSLLSIFSSPSVMAAASRNGFQPQSDCPSVVIRDNGGMGFATFAKVPIRAGSRFLHVEGHRLSFPTTHTIMMEETSHLLFAAGAQYLAHSCEGNVRICVDEINNALECEALRDIPAGELVSFNYNSTEWDMASPFSCLCGSPECSVTIRGYKHLTSAQRLRVQPLITPAVRKISGMYWDVQLPHSLEKQEDGRLQARTYIPKEKVVLEVFFLDVQPSQICVGRDYTITHSSEYNCVYVEGRIISAAPISPGDYLTVNLNFFVYDMARLFPRAFSDDCKGFRYLEESFKQKYLYLCEPSVRRQAMLDGWIVVSPQTALTIKPNGDMGQTAFASRDIAAGVTLFHCTGLLVPFPTMYTICVGDSQQHLLFGNGAECIAHHCDPNVRVKVNGDGTFDFVTVKPIPRGDLVTFNYNTTEWLMNTPFPCLCGSKYCAGLICGFHALKSADQQRLWAITSNVVQKRAIKARESVKA